VNYENITMPWRGRIRKGKNGVKSIHLRPKSKRLLKKNIKLDPLINETKI
jgi:hypothetical protein